VTRPRITVCCCIPIFPERENTMTTRDEVERLLASRPDLTASQRTYLRGVGSAERISTLLAALPVSATVTTPAASTRSATAGATTRAARLPAREHAELVERFGRRDRTMPHWDGNDYVLPQITPIQARKILDEHAKRYGTAAEIPMRRTVAGDGLVASVGQIAATVAMRSKSRGE
jgi:hypothetical protein